MIIWSLAIVPPGLVAWGISCHQAQTHAVQSKPKILTENSKFKVGNVILTFFAVFSRVRTVHEQLYVPSPLSLHCPPF